MTKTIHEAFVGPFLKIRDFILSNPHGKRFPNDFHSSLDCKRNGQDNITVFTSRWLSLQENYPNLITEQDSNLIEPVFELYYKLNP
jgi:hypothetical protein